MTSYHRVTSIVQALALFSVAASMGCSPFPDFTGPDVGPVSDWSGTPCAAEVTGKACWDFRNPVAYTGLPAGEKWTLNNCWRAPGEQKTPDATTINDALWTATFNPRLKADDCLAISPKLMTPLAGNPNASHSFILSIQQKVADIGAIGNYADVSVTFLPSNSTQDLLTLTELSGTSELAFSLPPSDSGFTIQLQLHLEAGSVSKDGAWQVQKLEIVSR